MQKITLFLNEHNQAEIYPATSLSDLKNHPTLYKIYVIVPAQTILLTHAKLPKLSPHRLLQALPYALEEQLLSEVNELHFAIGPTQTEDIPVAVVTKTQMDKWISELTELGIKPSVMIPETLGISFIPDQWHISIRDNLAIVRTHIYDGFSCDKHNLNQMLTLKLNETLNKPHQIIIDNYSNTAIDFKVNEIKIIENNLSSKDFLSHLHTNETYPINLLQQQYAAKNSISQNKKIWRLSTYLAVAIILLLFTSNLVSFLILNNQVSALDHSIAKIYKHHFPLASSIIAPKERMQEKLNKLNSQPKNHILLWLALIGKNLKTSPSVTLTQLDFHNGQLNLQVTAANSNNLDAFSQLLNAEGLRVRQQEVTVENQKVKGMLVITENNKL